MQYVRKIMRALLLLGVLSAALTACEEECTPGDTQACTCDDQRPGVHVCRPDGEGWTDCNCLGQ